jgi:hypothetical protein
LVEKILWAAPDVERINVLIRPKRKFGGRVQTPAERLRRELFQSSVFDRLRYRHGEQLERFLAQKLHAVAGDISEDGLGIDPNVRAQLERELDVVINSAAVVSFDAPLDDEPTSAGRQTSPFLKRFTTLPSLTNRSRRVNSRTQNAISPASERSSRRSANRARVPTCAAS